ncbi:hypothetical protein ACFQ9J_16735 [Streptomyces sp. NPDC056529]|uniref:hypothetical protein n=1 Tax=Streptomyces sp. NPDC056529 TaxID=3345855 RepID=UPI00368BFA4A
MNATEAEAAFETARWEQHLDRDHEDLFGDERGPAKLAEWEQIVPLLTTTGGIYNPESDTVVQDELAAKTAAAAVREAEQEEARRIEARADELQALAEAGALRRAEPRRGDENARDALARRPDWFLVQADIDGWLAHALATHRGHYADPATRDTAVGLLPEPGPYPRHPAHRAPPPRSRRRPRRARLRGPAHRRRSGRRPRTHHAPQPRRQRHRGAGVSGDQAREVAYWQETGWTGTRCETLLADGTVEAWTEPPFGETRYPDEDAPDYNTICDCPTLFPAALCVECGGYTATCGQCVCHRPVVVLTRPIRLVDL